jgi:predicted  nucleic acid-binding Zn-ribbon protein
MEKWEARMEKSEGRMEKSEARMEKSEARMDRIEKRLDGVTKILRQDMKILVKFQTETNSKIDALVDGQLRLQDSVEKLERAQMTTEQKFQKLLDWLRENRNGHHGRRSKS